MRYTPQRLIALNQLFGAVLIVLALVAGVVQQPGHLPSLYPAAATLMAGVSAYAGYELLRLSRRGVVLSLWLQGLQVLNAAGPTFDARLELGAKATVDVTATRVMTHWGFGGTFGFWPWVGATELVVIVNGLALVAFVWLWRHRQSLAPAAALATRAPASESRAV